MTNDGILTHQLTHPSFEHEKEYRVLVHPRPTEQQLHAWRKGMILDDGSCTLPAKTWIEHKNSEGTWLGVILKEGKKRQIRRMAESSGLQVRRLIRIRIGNLVLGELLPGEWRELTGEEINDTCKAYSLKKDKYGKRAVINKKDFLAGKTCFLQYEYLLGNDRVWDHSAPGSPLPIL